MCARMSINAGSHISSEKSIYLPVLVLRYCYELTLGNPINLTPCIIRLYQACAKRSVKGLVDATPLSKTLMSVDARVRNAGIRSQYMGPSPHTLPCSLFLVTSSR